ncbi:putative G-protein gamma [Helianthus annuus]|uniref:G-protein gamma n=1 Tax=Helianthus annuus TaxID=4232 RepID=A0A251RZE9_HELAN|nr:putative G-protein gamma [Helianthus annuus]KAJ0494485.1 putative G-protein gamma [Helianthus annuus]KAJ0863729.1 putative G-protein gamma [Helianthus annuus]KAJ0867623.1 putative G-protein gamma [Helianthus annuus]
MQSEQVRSMVADTTVTGKHRISAAFNKLQQETHSLQKELEQLENTEAASSVCKDILHDVETRPDPLLPITSEPNPSWDRWFEGPQDKSVCKCCIM